MLSSEESFLALIFCMVRQRSALPVSVSKEVAAKIGGKVVGKFISQGFHLNLLWLQIHRIGGGV